MGASMRRNKRTITAVLMLTLLWLGTINAQIDTLYEDSLCSYTWNSDLNECPDILDCIIPDKWDGKSVGVPANITHISKEGLKICLDDLELTAPADIIYIIDLSGSMFKYYGGTSPAVVVKYPENNWQEVGDPYRMRDDALAAGFNYQIDNLKGSIAGYIGFGGDVINKTGHKHILEPVSVMSGQAQMNSMVSLLKNDLEYDGNGTNYYAPLVLAKKWAQNSTLMPDETKAIIFISDGEAFQSSGNATQVAKDLSNLGVKIHGIYLGTNAGSDLTDIVNATNGTITTVPQNKSDELGKVVEEIVETFKKEFEFQTISVTNLDLNITANVVSSIKTNDTFALVTDKTIPLQKNDNSIEVKAKFGTPDGKYDTTMTFTFNVDVGGEKYTNECFYCWGRTKLSALVNNVIIDTLTWENDSFTIKLQYFGLDTLDKIDVMVTTMKGDSEVVTIDKWSHNGNFFTFEKTVAFSVLTSSETDLNDIVESDFEDLVSLSWTHPTEPLDTASASVVVSAPPNRMEIHDKGGTPQSSSKYATSPEVDTVTAGITAKLFAKVFANQKWLDAYETDATLYKDITWGFVNIANGQEDATIGDLSPTAGIAETKFYPKKAYHTIDLTATLTIVGLPVIKETIRLYIQPGDPAMLSIEATNDSLKSNLNDAVPYDPIVLFGNENSDTAFGILRDIEENWVYSAKNALWSVKDEDVVTVEPGPNDTAFIKKGTLAFGTTKLYGEQDGFKDTVTVKTLEYDIVAIEIVRVHKKDTSEIESLLMNSNEDTILVAYGQRSDDLTLWLPVDVDWFIDPDATEKPAPSSKSSWSFSPSRPDTGIINIELAGLTDTIDYFFTVGPVTKVEFNIITPDSLLIAGEPIQGEVKIYNEDGLVPGTWKYPDSDGKKEAKYNDVLDNGGLKFTPFVTTVFNNGKKTDKSDLNLVASVEQWFEGGIDTCVFILYYAPVPKKEHMLTVDLGTHDASTDPFVLLPGALDSIVINTGPIDTKELGFDTKPFIIKATGWDKFGNFLPNEIFQWENDSSLFQFSIDAQATQIYIDPSKVSKTQEGFIHVNGISVDSITNKVFLKIIGPLPKLMSALTKDENGNGFLDGILISFDKEINIPDDLEYDFITVQYEKTSKSVTFPVTNVTAFLGNKKLLLLHLDEKESIKENLPQTAWRPYLTMGMSDDDGLDTIVSKINKYKCIDGAAPVIWAVTNTFVEAGNHKKDVVKVTFSEIIKDSDGSTFKTGKKPSEIFRVWKTQNDGKDTIEILDMFKGIKSLKDHTNDWVNFNMTNNNLLDGSHLLNINHKKELVTDEKTNYPNIYNQKVRVRVSNAIGDITILNPITPNIDWFLNVEKEDPLNWIDPKEAVKEVQDNGGTIITIDNIQNIGDAAVGLMVFDAIGNLVVNIKDNSNVIKTTPKWMQEQLEQGIGSHQLVFIWTGVSARGMPCAPGVYKMIFTMYFPRNPEKKAVIYPPMVIAIKK